MSEHGTECSLLLSATMTHNEFDMERDFLEPLQNFLATNYIEYNTREKIMTSDFGSTLVFENMKGQEGYNIQLFAKVDKMDKNNK